MLSIFGQNVHSTCSYVIVDWLKFVWLNVLQGEALLSGSRHVSFLHQTRLITQGLDWWLICSQPKCERWWPPGLGRPPPNLVARTGSPQSMGSAFGTWAAEHLITVHTSKHAWVMCTQASTLGKCAHKQVRSGNVHTIKHAWKMCTQASTLVHYIQWICLKQYTCEHNWW